MAGRILGMGDVVGLVEKAQEVIDEKEAAKAAQKLQKGQFSFEDFLQQLNMIRKLGPLKKVLGMLPGVGQMLKDVDFDDAHFKRIEAVILSMTPRERRKPDLIDLPRRRRIAAGSGNALDAVNALIKQFKAMQDMMKKLGKGGLGGPGGLGGMGGGGLGNLESLLGGQRPGGAGPRGFPGQGFPGLPGRRR